MFKLNGIGEIGQFNPEEWVAAFFVPVYFYKKEDAILKVENYNPAYSTRVVEIELHREAHDGTLVWRGCIRQDMLCAPLELKWSSDVIT